MTARRRDPGIDEDEIEGSVAESPAQGGDAGIVVDVELLDLDVAAGFRRERLDPLLAARVAHGRDHIPAAPLQLGREPQPQPARCPDDERPAWFGHHQFPSLYIIGRVVRASPNTE